MASARHSTPSFVADRGVLLSVQDLRVEFWTSRGTIHAVNGISFDIAPGETLGIVGESGCGKSVTALALMGILPRAGRVTTGSALFGGRDLIQLSDKEMRDIRGREVAMIFQDPMTSLNPVLTIGRQLREAIETHFDMSTKEANQRSAELLDRVGIPSANERIRDYPHQFSGGMRQRAMIAMALACKPKVLIADEPTTALDVTIQAQILELLRELVAEENAALIMITHDLGVVAGMCERVNVMYAGMFMETGTARQLFAKPRHPYTLGLLQSIPRLDAARKSRLHPIEGAPRDMLRPPAACPFQPRCRYEVEASSQEVPPLEEIERGHKVACFNPVPEDEWQNMRNQVVAP
jgi:oligopeptide transport system ATP-binding protein